MNSSAQRTALSIVGADTIVKGGIGVRWRDNLASRHHRTQDGEVELMYQDFTPKGEAQ